jgi:hypothetical protein
MVGFCATATDAGSQQWYAGIDCPFMAVRPATTRWHPKPHRAALRTRHASHTVRYAPASVNCTVGRNQLCADITDPSYRSRGAPTSYPHHVSPSAWRDRKGGSRRDHLVPTAAASVGARLEVAEAGAAIAVAERAARTGGLAPDEARQRRRLQPARTDQVAVGEAGASGWRSSYLPRRRPRPRSSRPRDWRCSGCRRRSPAWDSRSGWC